MTERRPFVLKLQRTASDGNKRSLLARGMPQLERTGEVTSFWGFLEDISDIEQIDQERELLKAACEQTAEMILITDKQERIVYANAAFSAITGYNFEELLGKTPRIISSGKHDKSFFEEMWSVLLKGETSRGRMVDRRKDGSFFTEDSTITPMKNSEGQVTHYIGIKSDVTEELAKEAKRAEAQKLESIGRLAGGLAHDFNNMLQVIIGHIEQARKCSSPTNSLLPTLDIIQQAATRAGNLTGQLLAYAREQPANPQVIRAGEQVQNVLAMLKRVIGENIDLELENADEHDQIRIDPVQLDQIVTNLCVNARDAVGEHGRISINIKNRPYDQISASRRVEMKEGGYLCICVTDDGPGIPNNALDHIFEPFFSTKPKHQGTGLGLSTVLGIVKQNDGYVFVDSEQGEGTTFSIYFPLTSEKENKEIGRAHV